MAELTEVIAQLAVQAASNSIVELSDSEINLVSGGLRMIDGGK